MDLARGAYKSTYGKGMFEIICGVRSTLRYDGKNEIYNGPICLLIEHFGDLFTKIRLERRFTFKYIAELEHCIVKNCSKSLIEMELISLNQHTSLLKNLYPNIEVLAITCAVLDDDLIALNECCPMLKNLSLNSIVYCSAKFINNSFRFLQHLTVCDAAYNKLGTIVNLNRQIRSLHISWNYTLDPNLCKFINDTLPHLEELSLDLECILALTSSVSFKNVKKLKIDIKSCFWDYVIAHCPLKFDALEDLCINGCSNVIEFIEKNRGILALKISSTISKRICKSIIVTEIN